MVMGQIGDMRKPVTCGNKFLKIWLSPHITIFPLISGYFNGGLCKEINESRTDIPIGLI